ncbi:LysR family transcriptional regulator [Anaerostipes sp. 494a]|uniref:LysR family transcriptional regulator n=1 Tax=Anaerostipes sp. 494a TaxID=1261636 RepID=UPI0009523C9E|nr:LysR family transcriptional regulator [Anaerostipes sp. 494a]MDY2727146.1 LysR family transcriptional regulator [Anaerostipes faecalis]OLR58349.1 LysR family transcriptional regulator [Anaerostipes sp. 494a]
MNLNHLYYFRALAKEEHYTRTADNLSITQPSLSHAISCLEGELGVKLFEKQGRNAKLTKYGQLFLRYVEQSLAMLDEGKRILTEASGLDGGYIDIGYIYTLGSHFIPQVINHYMEKKGENHIRFSFGQGTTKRIIQGLKEGKYDFVFSSYIKDEENLEFIPVAEEELVLITPKDHPLADEKSVNLGDTTQYDYIYFSKNSGLRNVIDQLFSKVKGYPKIAYEGEEDSTVAGLVAAGFGIAIVPNIPLLNTMDVSVIPISSPEIHRYIYLVTLKKKYLAPVAEEFVEFVKNNYSVKG